MTEIFDNLNDWMDYSKKAWIEVGKPAQLDPTFIMTQPMQYDVSIYRWFEASYGNTYKNLYQGIGPQSTFINQQPEFFRQKWATHFDPITIWKQLIPLFVFANTLGGIKDQHIELAKAYAVGKAITSTVVDHMLDRPFKEKQPWQDNWLFCFSTFTLAIEQIRSVKDIPHEIETLFLHYTRDLYFLFWEENQTRFQLPKSVSDQLLQEYIYGKSRLLSSIFFGLTIEWAFILAERLLPSEFPKALLALRKVRQLNDELIDFDDDIQSGLLTYPYLHCLTSIQYGQKLANNIRETWNTNSSTLQLDVQSSLNVERRKLLQLAGSLEETAITSSKLLRVSMKAMMEYFSVKEAFEITLLLNLRLAFLSRLAQNNWQNVSDIYQPDPFSANKSSS